jgi:phosphate-selective porin
MMKSRAGPGAWLLASTLFINMNLLSDSMAQESRDTRDPPPVPSQREPGELSLEERIKRLELRNEELRAILHADFPANVPPDPSTTDGRVENPPLDLRGRLFPNKVKDPEEYRLQAYWNNGFEVRSDDNAFVINIGGRIDFDNSWYQLPSAMQPTLTNPLLDGSELRRARLRAGGTVYTQFEYLFEVDLSSGSDFFTLTPNPAEPIYLTDAWIAMNQVPVLGSIKVGHQRELLTFSNSMSGNFLPFMERPYIFDAFNDFFQFSTGISATRNYFDDHLQTWVGFFRTGTRTGAFGVGDGDGAFSARMNWQPFLSPEDQTWATLSAAGSVRTIPKDPGYMYYFARPLVRAGSAYQVPFLINTPELYSSDLVNYLNFNAHAAWKRLTFGGEYLASWVNNVSNGGMPVPGATQPATLTPLGNIYLDGYYLEALCFLTNGDHHPLDTKTMSLGRVIPNSPFICREKEDPNQSNGWGAWEIGLRLDYLNFNSGALQAGTLNSISTGINWYWNANMRLMGNYIYTFREVDMPNGTGNIQAFGIRAHVDF